MIAGNADVVMKELFSRGREEEEALSGELPRLVKPGEELSRVVHGYLDQQ